MKKILQKLFLLLLLYGFCIQVFAQDVFTAYIPKENEIVFNQSTYYFDIIDPQANTNAKGANYPGS